MRKSIRIELSETGKKILVAILLTLIVLFIGFHSTIKVMSAKICEFCIENNFTQKLTGDLTVDCRNFTAVERMRCFQLILRK